MGFSIVDGTGSGREVLVTKDNELVTVAHTEPLQHVLSIRDGEAYQVLGDTGSVTNTTQVILHIQNTSSTKLLVATYIRVQAIDLAGGTALPSGQTFWQIGFGTTVSSGGAARTPTNLNRTSGNTADVTALSTPTIAGTFTEIDRYYSLSSEEMEVFNKQGSIVLGKNDTLDIRLTTDHTSGIAYARCTFVMIDI